MTAVQWEEPGPLPGGKPTDKYAEFADALRANPGKWAIYPGTLTPSSATQTAKHVKRGELTTWAPAGAFEATVRTLDDGFRRLYVRFVGGSS